MNTYKRDNHNLFKSRKTAHNKRVASKIEVACGVNEAQRWISAKAHNRAYRVVHRGRAAWDSLRLLVMVPRVSVDDSGV